MAESVSYKMENESVALSGPMTIETVAGVRQGLLGLIGDLSVRAIDVTGLGEVDIAGLQLLCAAHRSMARNGREVRLVGAPEALLRAVSEAGFLHDKGCADDPGGTCFWMGGVCRE